MREPILKAVAMPPRVFWAPMMPAVINLCMQAPLLFIFQLWSVNPLWFIPAILAGHLVAVFFGRREPHISKMAQSYGPFMIAYKNVYPGRGHKLAP